MSVLFLYVCVHDEKLKFTLRLFCSIICTLYSILDLVCTLRKSLLKIPDNFFYTNHFYTNFFLTKLIMFFFGVTREQIATWIDTWNFYQMFISLFL